ncbi:MAG: metallophosphoesterase family protein, partial [Thermomicrobiales bacterium]
MFDRSFLPEARFEFVVVTDTHYMPDPGKQPVEFESRRQQTARGERALRQIASLEAAFVVHLGDVVQAFPDAAGFEQAVSEALAQLRRCGVHPRLVAGNHDVGDKPDPTMPTNWVTPGALAAYHARFGRSWYSWEDGGCHFVVLNSQIMNSALPEATAHRQWVESDLAANAGTATFMFLHLAPFLHDEDEPGLGHYDNIDQPARGWLINLTKSHNVQMLFAGHSHFMFFNRIGAARSFVVPSTSFTRPGFSELFSSCPPPERGRNDIAKL